jgi:hypothetical protein
MTHRMPSACLAYERTLFGTTTGTPLTAERRGLAERIATEYLEPRAVAETTSQFASGSEPLESELEPNQRSTLSCSANDKQHDWKDNLALLNNECW